MRPLLVADLVRSRAGGRFNNYVAVMSGRAVSVAPRQPARGTPRRARAIIGNGDLRALAALLALFALCLWLMRFAA